MLLSAIATVDVYKRQGVSIVILVAQDIITVGHRHLWHRTQYIGNRLGKFVVSSDMLVGIVKNMRNYIENAGGEFCFSSKMTDIQIENGKVCAIIINDTQKIETDCLVLAIGHSARDTFSLLKSKNLPMEAKAFAVGLRADCLLYTSYGKEHCFRK